jgi:ABC-type antimicrobial peptide transport system permease subunit
LRTRFVREGLATVVIGTLGGIACAASAGKLLGRLIEGATAFDIVTYVLATISICLVAAASIWVATRRIAGMDVVEILRAG